MKASFFQMSTLSHPATPHPHHPLLKHTYLKGKGTAYAMELEATETMSFPDSTFPKMNS